MTKEQVYKALIISIFAILFMFVFEVVFSIKEVCDCVSNWIASVDGWVVYFIIWLVVFIQITIVPIPMWIVINTAVILPSINLSLTSVDGWMFVFDVLLASVTGVSVAYVIGRKYGVRAIKWCAGDENEFNKWSNLLNKKGRFWYALTVLLPVFPDDILCFVAGSLKLNFAFFIMVNLFCRLIGIIAMIYSLTVLQKANNFGFPITAVLWGVLLVCAIIACLILRHKINKNKKRDMNEESV